MEKDQVDSILIYIEKWLTEKFCNIQEKFSVLFRDNEDNQKSNLNLERRIIQIEGEIVLLKANEKDTRSKIDKLETKLDEITILLKKKNRWPLIFLLSVMGSPLVVKGFEIIVSIIFTKQAP